MATEAQGTFEVDGHKLHSTTWTPPGPIKAKLVFVHGFSDHVGRYHELFPYLAGRGIQVFSWDQRPTSRVLADVAAFIRDKLSSSSSAGTNVPIFVMGHSMGGGQVLALASNPQYNDIVAQVRGWLLESPFIAFTPGEEPSFLKVFFGKLASRVLPRQQLVNEIPAEQLTRDPAVQQSIRDDDMMHNTGTLEGLAGCSRGQTHWPTPGGQKPVARPRDRGQDDMLPRQQEMARRAEHRRQHAQTVRGAYHQLHADLCKDEFFKDVGDWIIERAGEAAAKPESKL
ncbi:alpha/beta hydrolase [Colletotrichum tofieldiae]|nr:alpha/beta hydrolase [Colletotrichum tofieldiae]